MASAPKAERFDVAAMREAIRSFLRGAGFEIAGTELEHTPDNVARAWIESYLDGYQADPAVILKDAYETAPGDGASQSVLLKGIRFHGMCPHHLLPFHGRAHVAYIPGKKLASLSSLARLVDCYAHRLEIQEVVTRQIAEALATHLQALGAAVVLDTDQTCMTTRGVTREDARTVTQHFTGDFADRSDLRADFLTSIP
jgi:GTP cyclohydrolase I